jgi:hypothetical protein
VKKLLLILLILIAGVTSYTQYAERPSEINPAITINYNLSKPDKTYLLPHELNEISGLTETGESSFAGIQDENGILYIYDLTNEKIIKEFTFHGNGDYEGIARVDKTIYVLRSDGKLYEINNFESGNSNIESYSTGISAKDNEGLCFDKDSNRLLIAPKSEPEKHSGNKDKRFIYAFDLRSKKLIGNPVYTFDLSLIRKFAAENNLKVPKNGGKKGDKDEPDIEFRPSAIGIHPVTNKLYLISGMEELLFVFDIKGNIEFMTKLDKDLFNQPEGITFLKNGDMLISNEKGQKNRATVLRFNYSLKTP